MLLSVYRCFHVVAVLTDIKAGATIPIQEDPQMNIHLLLFSE